MRKLLYLEGSNFSRIVRDGPSLICLAEGVAPRRFPLARVGRIALSGAIECQAEALSACLAEGVVIAILDAAGGAAGYLLPAGGTQRETERRLHLLSTQPAGPGLYAEWKRATQRREQLETLRRMGLRAPDLRPGPLAGFLASRIAVPGGWPPVPALVSHVTALLALQTARCLADRGVTPGEMAGGGSGLNLMEDFAGILSWSAYSDLAAYSRNATPEPGERFSGEWKRSLVAMSESHTARDLARAARLWERFRFWLGTVL